MEHEQSDEVQYAQGVKRSVLRGPRALLEHAPPAHRRAQEQGSKSQPERAHAEAPESAKPRVPGFSIRSRSQAASRFARTVREPARRK